MKYLPTTSVKYVETMVINFLQENIRNIDEDLEKLQKFVFSKNFVGTTIPEIDTIRRILEHKRLCEL
jgi:hypothetical protein